MVKIVVVFVVKIVVVFVVKIVLHLASAAQYCYQILGRYIVLPTFSHSLPTII